MRKRSWLPSSFIICSFIAALLAVVSPGNTADIEKSAEQTEAGKSEPKAQPEKDAKEATPVKIPSISRETDGFDIIAGPYFNAIGSSPSRDVARALRTAQFHVKIGSAEHGNLTEFDSALHSLEAAAREIANREATQPNTLLEAVRDLQSEVRELRTAAATTFYGRFPLLRANGLSAETDEEFEVRSYARPGEAYRRAVRGALTQIAKSASSGPLHVLILVPGETRYERKSGDLARVVDSQAHEAFSNAANITVYLGALRAAVDPMPSWNSPDPAFDPICRQFLRRIDPRKEPRSLMLVMVREFVDDVSDGHWIQTQQRTYEASSLEKAEEKPEKLEADKVKIFESMSHDRSRFSLGLLIASITVFGLSILTHRILSTALHAIDGGWHRWLAVPAAGFLIGMALTPCTMLAMKRWLPEAQSDAMSAAWWPALTGALCLVLPAGVFRLAAGTVGRYFPGLSCHGRWGISFVPVALGVCAAWMGPTCYAMGLHCTYVLLMLGIAASLIVYCFGRAVDIADEFPVAVTPITLGLSLMFGMGAFMGSPMVLAVVIGLTFLTMSIHTLSIWQASSSSSPSDSEKPILGVNSQTPKTLEQLRAALKAPRYHAPLAFKQLTGFIKPSEIEQIRWIGLLGPVAAGKTAAAQHLIDEIRLQQPNVQVLAGRCSENSPPYKPFREALAELGASAGIIASSSQGGEVNTVFERLADEFIPFWDFFSFDEDDSEGRETSRHDLLEGVLNTLRDMTQRQAVVLFLDDVQWIDEGSTALLKYIHENFGTGANHPLTIVLAGREQHVLKKLELEAAIFSLPSPSTAEQIQFLQLSFGIEQVSARHLVKALGVMSQESGSIFWLIRAVSELVAEEALFASPSGFQLKPSYLQNRQLPVPQEMRAKLGAALRSSGQYLPVLECAALFGVKFRVNDLADTLEMDRLLLLQILRHLEQELQLVRDVTADPDCYEFSSEFMLEIVREELTVVGRRGSRSPSKIARELHGRIAAVLERRTPRTSQLIYDLAHHYHAAGPAYADRCIESCFAAAETARRQHAFHAARRYLTMAEERDRVNHRANEFAENRLKIELDESQATNECHDRPVVTPVSRDAGVRQGQVGLENSIGDSNTLVTP